MSNQENGKFKDSESAKQYIDNLRRHIGVSRAKLAEDYLRVSGRTLAYWLKDGEIPEKHFKYLQELLKQKAQESDNNSSQSPNNNGLDNYSDGELIAELVKRGLKINIGG